MDEGSVANVFIKTLKDIFGDTFSLGISHIILLQHLSLVILVENIGVQD
jgi:hypothetical protein